MIQLTDSDFRTLCAAGTVSERIGALEGERKAAVRKFWLRGTIGLVLTGAALATLLNAGWEVVAFLVFAAFLVGTFIAAAAPLMAAREGLKHPVLDEVAKRAGLEYFPADFVPPAFGSARSLLFGGSGFSSETYSGLFNGTDGEGRRLAVDEACLRRRAGRNSHVVFSGQIYAIQRRPAARGEIAKIVHRSR